ncbi:MAG: hypothetical protein ACT4OW_04005 [Nitrososphaerota archaeon]
MKNATVFTIVIGTTFLAFTLSLLPTFAMEYKVTTDNSEVQCRQEQVLLYRFYGRDYLCIDISAAARWSQLGLAEIVRAPVQIQEDEKKEGCMTGLVSVYRVYVDKNACVKESTAEKWQEIGIATIIDDEFRQKIMESKENESAIEGEVVESEEEISEIEVVPEMEEVLVYVMQDSVRIDPNNDSPLAQVWCNSGDYATGGGYTVGKGLDTKYIYKNTPIKDETSNRNGWEVGAENNGYTSQTLTVYVVCQVP